MKFMKNIFEQNDTIPAIILLLILAAIGFWVTSSWSTSGGKHNELRFEQTEYGYNYVDDYGRVIERRY